MLCLVDTWEAEQAKRIGAAVKLLRGDRTAQWLAARTEEIGVKMTRQTITDLENGRRRYVTTAELAVLAHALNTAPMALLYPGPDYGEFLDVLPGRQDRQIRAVQWFSGERDHGYTDTTDGLESAQLRAKYRENIQTLTRWRKLGAIESEISSITTKFASTEAGIALLRRLNDDATALRVQLGLEVGDGG